MVYLGIMILLNVKKASSNLGEIRFVCCHLRLTLSTDYSPSFDDHRPKQGDLKPYLAAIDRLVAASEALRKTDAKGRAATLAQMVRKNPSMRVMRANFLNLYDLIDRVP